MFHMLEHALSDSVKLLPFLFLTYLLMEILEHHTGTKAQERIRTAGKFGPVFGGLLGVIPQCGFSAAASSLYASRVITIGTLMAVYLSASDEMLPVLISEGAPFKTIVGILTVKAIIAVVSGFIVEWAYERLSGKGKANLNIHAVCEEAECHCEGGVVVSALKHTLQIFVYIFVLSFMLHGAIETVGEDALAGFLSGTPLLGELISAMVGLIPNCASSVIITKLYLSGVIGAGAMMAGLLVNAGVGLMVLFRSNHDFKHNLGIVSMLYGLGVFWGVLIEAAGIVF